MRVTGIVACLLLSLATTACTNTPQATPVPASPFDPAAVACVDAHPSPPPFFAGEHLEGGANGSSGSFTVACPMLVNPRHIDWRTAVIAKDDRTISIYFFGGTICSGVLQRVEVAETPATVTIDLYLGVAPLVKPSEERVCDAIGHSYVAVVRLAEPLGTRQLKTPPMSSDHYPTVVSHL